MSAEGAALCNCCKFNHSNMLAVDLVPRLQRSFPFHSSLPASRPGLFSVGPLDLKSKKLVALGGTAALPWASLFCGEAEEVEIGLGVKSGGCDVLELGSGFGDDEDRWVGLEIFG